jgi:hypothetical protein
MSSAQNGGFSLWLDLTPAGWAEVAVDLSSFAGRTVKLELINEPTGWRYEAAFWSEISLQSE